MYVLEYRPVCLRPYSPGDSGGEMAWRGLVGDKGGLERRGEPGELRRGLGGEDG